MTKDQMREIATRATKSLMNRYPIQNGDPVYEEIRAAIEEAVSLEREPPLGLLVSIAMRLDHSFLLTGPLLGETEQMWHARRAFVLADARRVWEEVAGKGFWKPELNEQYESQHMRIVNSQDAIRQSEG